MARLDDAFVDGQLNDADRDVRVSQALAARTLGELDALVRDLQATSPSAILGSNRRWAAIVPGAVCVVLLIVGVVTMSGGDEPDEPSAVAKPVAVDASSSVPTSEPTAEASQEPQPDSTARPLTRRYFEDFRDAYRKRFGGTKIYDARFDDDGSVSFSRPLSRARPDLLQDWQWYPATGFEKSTTRASPNVFEEKPFDLSTVDAQRLAYHVVQGRKYLGVRNPGKRMAVTMPEAHPEVYMNDPQTAITVTVTNDYGDTGNRYVSPDGRLLESAPFAVNDQ